MCSTLCTTIGWKGACELKLLATSVQHRSHMYTLTQYIVMRGTYVVSTKQVMAVSSEGSRQSVSCATYRFNGYNDEGCCIATNVVRLLSSVLSSACSNYNDIDYLYRMATMMARGPEVSVSLCQRVYQGDGQQQKLELVIILGLTCAHVSRHYLLLWDIWTWECFQPSVLLSVWCACWTSVQHVWFCE